VVENLGGVTAATHCPFEGAVVRFISFLSSGGVLNQEWNTTSDTMLWQHASITKLKMNATF